MELRRGSKRAKVALARKIAVIPYGCIPSDLGVGTNGEIEEQRRLLYVAMMRAKEQLHLVVPQRFYVHGQLGNGARHVYAQRTRFIPASITRHLVLLMAVFAFC